MLIIARIMRELKSHCQKTWIKLWEYYKLLNKNKNYYQIKLKLTIKIRDSKSKKSMNYQIKSKSTC